MNPEDVKRLIDAIKDFSLIFAVCSLARVFGLAAIAKQIRSLVAVLKAGEAQKEMID